MPFPKYPKEYTEGEVGLIKDPFKPEFRYDSRGRLIMPLPGFSKMMLSVEPGSKKIGQGSEDEAGNPQTDPGSLKTGYLHAQTSIIVGPEGGWVTQLAGGAAEYPISYFNEATKVMKFYLDKSGNVYLKGKIIADPDSEVDWSYIKNIAVQNIHIAETLVVGNTEAKCTDPNADQTFANPQSVDWLTDAGAMAKEDLVELAKLGSTIIQGGYLQTILIDAEYITAGIMTGRTVQTAFPIGTNKVIRLSSVNTHKMEFLYGSDIIGALEVTYNPANAMSGFALMGGGGAIVHGSGKSNMGVMMIALTNKYFGLDWYAGSSATERIVTNAKIDADWSPYQAGRNLGGSPSANKWQHLYLSGNVNVGADVNVTDDIMLGDDLWPDNVTPHSTSSIGWSGNYLHQLYTYLCRWKSSQAFQKYDDIALIKKIKTKKIKTREADKLVNNDKKKKVWGKEVEKEVWDGATMPKEVYPDGFYDAGAMSGFLIGTIKQLIEKVEQLEAKIFDKDL